MAFVHALAEQIRRAAQAAGVPPEQAVEVAEEVEAWTRAEYGAQRPYVHALDRQRHYAQVRRLNNGRNRDALCARFGISRATFYRIIREKS